MIAALVAVAAFCAVLALRRRRVDPDLYLATPMPAQPRLRRTIRIDGAAALGAVAGLVAANGLGVGAASLAVPGASIGVLGRRVTVAGRRRRRARTLLLELPTVADTLALHVLAGDSVSTALHRLTVSGTGVAVDELRQALAAEPEGLEAALRSAATRSIAPTAARLYQLLAHAHRTGGPLAEALAALADDYRAAIAADLTAEGGRRSLAVYGPILALMIPVTLVFLMYPTLAGLNALANP